MFADRVDFQGDTRAGARVPVDDAIGDIEGFHNSIHMAAPWTGIERRQTTVTGVSGYDAVKSAANGGMEAWPSANHLNIWVCPLGGSCSVIPARLKGSTRAATC